MIQNCWTDSSTLREPGSIVALRIRHTWYSSIPGTRYSTRKLLYVELRIPAYETRSTSGTIPIQPPPQIAIAVLPKTTSSVTPNGSSITAIYSSIHRMLEATLFCHWLVSSYSFHYVYTWYLVYTRIPVVRPQTSGWWWVRLCHKMGSRLTYCCIAACQHQLLL